jgi:branched-chain amino acid transport system permease protein
MTGDDRLSAQVPPEQVTAPRVGVDEWVASHEGRHEHATGIRGELERYWSMLPAAARLGVFVIPAAFLPLVMNSGNLSRYGVYTLIYALFALGLNVPVGFAGILDLGYSAFIGFGAYGYAILASPQFGNHWQAELALPVVMIVTALVGLLVGLPSGRLVGDYLAIVTLFFGQAFAVFVNNANYINFCGIPSWVSHGAAPHWHCEVDLTGGANGIQQIDPLNLFGYKFGSVTQKFYFVLVAFVLVLIALYLANSSRTGRALRALREDPLAAEAMGMPVTRLKLLAFAMGAAIAGFGGAIYGSIQTGAFPGDYDVGLLITIYAIVILGGAGSLAGAALGAIVVNGVPELLRSQQNAAWLFYGVLLVVLVGRMRPWRKLAVFMASLLGFGFALHAIAGAAWPRLTAGTATSGGPLKHFIENWVLLPTNSVKLADFCFVFLIAAILAVSRLEGTRRLIALVPTLYLAAFVWENLLVGQIVGATRLILLGALLIALMNARPQGLLGTSRVEIV